MYNQKSRPKNFAYFEGGNKATSKLLFPFKVIRVSIGIYQPSSLPFLFSCIFLLQQIFINRLLGVWKRKISVCLRFLSSLLYLNYHSKTKISLEFYHLSKNKSNDSFIGCLQVFDLTDQKEVFGVFEESQSTIK